VLVFVSVPVIAIVLPILGHYSECGFKYEHSVTMFEYNSTTINSTIIHLGKQEDDDGEHRESHNYYCFSTVLIKPSFLCNIYTYFGSNLTNCIESQIQNGTLLSVHTTKKSNSCHLKNLSRNCEKSNIYFNGGVACIILLALFIAVPAIIGIFFLLSNL